jgi:hypothetical protein
MQTSDRRTREMRKRRKGTRRTKERSRGVTSWQTN